jgi:hypothetical protein
MRSSLGLTALCAVFLIAACGSSQDSVIVLHVDADSSVTKSSISILQVTVETITRDYTVTSGLPATLGILTAHAGTLSVSVVGIDANRAIGKWSGTATSLKGKVVTQDVVLSCMSSDCGTILPPSGDGAANDANGSGGSGAAGGAGSGGSAGTAGARSDAAVDAGGDVGSDARTTDDAGKKYLGVGCVGATECESGFCEQGVCCNSACAEPPANYMTAGYGHACMSCTIAPHVGTCMPLPTGTTAPTGQCLKEYESTCGMDGTCDGTGGCRLYLAGVQCEAPTCSNDSSNTASSARVCNGTHNCNSPTTTSCGLFACTAGVCKQTCTSNTDCVADAQCVSGACEQIKATNGTACTAGTQCSSGFCTDGVCCVAGSCANGCFTCSSGINGATPGTCQGSRCATCSCDGACHC